MPDAGIANVGLHRKPVERPAHALALGGERFDDYFGSAGVQFGHAQRITLLPEQEAES